MSYTTSQIHTVDYKETALRHNDDWPLRPVRPFALNEKTPSLFLVSERIYKGFLTRDDLPIHSGPKPKLLTSTHEGIPV